MANGNDILSPSSAPPRRTLHLPPPAAPGLPYDELSALLLRARELLADVNGHDDSAVTVHNLNLAVDHSRGLAANLMLIRRHQQHHAGSLGAVHDLYASLVSKGAFDQALELLPKCNRVRSARATWRALPVSLRAACTLDLLAGSALVGCIGRLPLLADLVRELRARDERLFDSEHARRHFERLPAIVCAYTVAEAVGAGHAHDLVWALSREDALAHRAVEKMRSPVLLVTRVDHGDVAGVLEHRGRVELILECRHTRSAQLVPLPLPRKL